MDYSVLAIDENQIRRDRNKFIFLFSIIPINLAITNIIGTAVSSLQSFNDEDSKILSLSLEYFVIVLVAILLEFVFYKLLNLKIGRTNLKAYNFCLVLFHIVLVYVVFSVFFA